MIAFFVGLGAFGYDLLVGFPRPHNPRVFGVPEKTERAPVGAREKLGNPGWQDALEESRLAMYTAGFWGAPSFVCSMPRASRSWLFGGRIGFGLSPGLSSVNSPRLTDDEAQ